MKSKSEKEPFVSAGGLTIGDHVLTPLGRPARVIGGVDDRINLEYLGADEVVLKENLLRRINARDPVVKAEKVSCETS